MAIVAGSAIVGEYVPKSCVFKQGVQVVRQESATFEKPEQNRSG